MTYNKRNSASLGFIAYTLVVTLILEISIDNIVC